MGTLTADGAQSPDQSQARTSPALPANAVTNRPTMSLSDYRAIKASSSAGARPAGPAAPAAPETVAVASGFNGIAQPSAESSWPSDSNGAVSSTQIAEVVNQHLTTYDKTGTQTSDRSFATLTGYTAQSLFDPRIIYDRNWNRFVAEVEAFPESTTVQYYFIMVSKTSSAAGGWFVYKLNVLGFCGPASSNPIWDYPQIGQTQDAVVSTANCFQGNTFVGSRTFGLAKALIYNAKGFSTLVFGISSADGTVTPANVLDQNPTMVLLTSNVHKIPFINPQGGSYESLGADTAISGFFTPSVPRSAGQAGCASTSCHLDTSDGRFVQDSTQYSTSNGTVVLWNVATYGISGNGTFATPSWGEFNISTASTVQRGQVFSDSCSDDFNASLVASTANSMWINWTSTDPQGSQCGQTFVRQFEAGRLSGTASGTVTNKVNAFTSPAELTGNFDPNFGLQRWGDTSSFSLDPSSAKTAWSVNNSVLNSNNWGTRWETVTNS